MTQKAHAAAPATGHQVTEELIRRVRAEFTEMPGLCLTSDQARRLWSLESRTCEALLKSLIDSRFLRRTDSGRFILRARRG